MAKPSKFGTFGGVFTPAILTILGVIMYMRLPWIVGNGGLYLTWGIIAVAHVVSLTTGLSVSSMATDKRVKAGGSYYILSRSLGLPIGGALGIALFVGLSFSVSLYVIGFSESFLAYFGEPVSSDNVRMVGTALLACVATVTLISTALAMKMQYFIMAAIVVSLISVGIGNPDLVRPEKIHYEALTGGVSLAVLFGIFFPAVTGFEAGVSMSGDLKDPKRSIPVGTMAAIFFGLIVYFALGAFFAWRIPAEELANNPRVLLDYSYMEELVVPGIWGATISSALGSMLGAPRILQACAADGIGPRLFERGVGAGNEPRNALFLTCFIAWCGVLIGELDAIARVVSMFFLTSYGFLNFAAFVESWVSPDFRPDFRIPRFVSLTGAVTCMLLMIQMDLAAMAGATIAMGLLYVLLKRRELALEGGDTWSGVWATLVRWSLDRLAKQKGDHERNWRPHILSFGGDGTRSLAEHFVGRSGLYSDLSQECGPGQAEAWVRRSNAVEYHGLPGLKPNTILLSLEEMLAAPEHALAFIESVDNDRFNILVSRSRPAIVPGRIDVWWRGQGGSLAFALALVRSVTAARRWRRGGVRFHIPIHNAADRRIVERRISHWLEQARVHADLRSADPEGLPAIERLSADAAITVLGLPGAKDPQEFASRLHTLTENLPHVLLVRPSSAFKDPLGEKRDAAAESRELIVVRRGEALLDDPTLAEMVGDIEQGLVEAFIEPLHHVNAELFDDLLEIADECEQIGERALRRLRRLESAELPMGPDVAARLRTNTWDALADLTARAARPLSVHQQWLISAADASDRAFGDVVLSTFRRLEVARVQKDGEVRIAVPEKRIDRWFLSRTIYLQAELAGLVAADAPDAFSSSLQRLVAARLAHVTALHLVALSLARVVEGEDTRSSWREELEEWRESLRDTARIEEAAARSAARNIAEKLAIRMRNARRRLVPQRAATAATWLDAEDLAATFAPRLAAIDEALELTGLELRMSVVLQALRGGVEAALDRMDQRLEHGLREDLRSLRKAIDDPPREAVASRRRGEFDVSPVLRDLSRTVETAVEGVPDTIRIVPEVVLARIEADTEIDDTEAQNVAVRQLVGYLLETEFLATTREAARALERAARRSEDLLRDATPMLADLSTTVEQEQDISAVAEELRERVERGQADLVKAETQFIDTVKQQLSDVEKHLSGSVIASEAGELSRFVRTQEQRRLVSSAAQAVKRWRSEANDRLVDLSLRWDAGWVAARDDRRVEPSVVEELLAFRSSIAPSAATLDLLPVFYRRAFTAQTNDAELIVGGSRVIERAREGLARYNSGHHGALLVTGAPGSGTTSAVRRILREVLEDRTRAEVVAPPVATCDVEAFEAAVTAAAMARAGDGASLDSALRGQPRGSVIVIHDLELWWHRGSGGLEVISRLESLIERYGSRLLFVITCNHASADLLRRLGLLEPSVVAHIEVQPMTAADAKDAVLRRHRASDLELRFSDGHESTEFALARYFSSMRELTGGAAGPLLAAWLAHIDDAQSDALLMRGAGAASLRAFGSLPVDWIPVVAAFAVHRRLDEEGLAAVLGGTDASAITRTLVRGGLVTQRDGVIELDRYMRPYVVRWLTEQGVLG